MEKCDNKVTENNSLWLLNFDIKSGGKGTAVIKARNPNKAVMLLKNNGIYNGTPNEYGVYHIEQIIESPDEMLISEQVVGLNIED